MTLYRLETTPLLSEAVMIGAFDGWIDASGASSGAAARLAEGAPTVAAFDADLIYDYRSRRPVLDVIDGTLTRLVWPEMRLAYRRIGGRDLKIGDLRPERPYLILNSTNGTESQFDQPFTFTAEAFGSIDSDVEEYSLARAVMATAAFPAVFNYMTLRDFRDCGPARRYVHVFDGGNSDNLGLLSSIKVMQKLSTDGTNLRNVVVILVDAYTDSNGVSAEKPDPRDFTDFIVDRNFLASSDALLFRNRENLLQIFKNYFATWYAADPARRQHAVFYHLQFNDIADPDLKKKLNQIATNFSIPTSDTALIDEAAGRLLTQKNDCLVAIKALLANSAHGLPDPVCTYSH